ncbi:MAG: hypothetical protein ACTSRA_22900 [Promethearchaeota archaeon]
MDKIVIDSDFIDLGLIKSGDPETAQDEEDLDEIQSAQVESDYYDIVLKEPDEKKTGLKIDRMFYRCIDR